MALHRHRSVPATAAPVVGALRSFVSGEGKKKGKLFILLDVVPVDISLYEGAPSVGPLGTKGAGEVPILNVGATVACAVANATGKRVQELPLTPPRVLELLLDCKCELSLPYIAEAWVDNLVRPHSTAAQNRK